MQRRSFIKTATAGALAPIAATAFASQQRAPAAAETPSLIPKDTIQTITSRIKPVTKEERAARVVRAQQIMAEEKIDALFCEGGISLNYLTGINWGRSERLFAMLLPKNGEPQFVAPKFEEARAQEQVGVQRLLTWEEHESPYALIAQVCADTGAATGTIGIEESTRQFVIDGIGRALGQAKLVSGTPVSAGCRSVKSAHELELMQIANDITQQVFTAAVTTLKEGMSERDLGSTISKLFSSFGVGGGALVLFGEASAYPHGTVKEHTLHEGQIVLIDGGCSVEGYNSDVTRTTSFGKASDKMQEVWRIVRDAQSAALALAKPGVPAEAIDAAAREVVTKGGYGPDYKYFTHRVGHGIGMDGHEWYYLVRGNTRPVAANNTFSDEPGIYIPGEFGIRLEDELQITENGARLMLPQAKSLETIF